MSTLSVNRDELLELANAQLSWTRICEGCGAPLPLVGRRRRYCSECRTPAARKARSNSIPEKYVGWESKPLPGSNEWLAVHGIDPGIWAARGVMRYRFEDREAVKSAFMPFLPNTKLGTVSRIVNQSDGLVMPKYAPPGLAPIPPQLRPDNPVITDARGAWHAHSATGSWPVFPEAAGSRAGKGLPRALVLQGRSLEEHLSKSRSEMPYDPTTGEGDHHGIDVPDVHYHAPDRAKYVLLGDNRRIDLHPWALERLPNAKRVFFVLEGALKNDAVLSAGEAVFSVPSVTLWNPKELKWFAQTFLVGKTIFVVPDADWAKNPAVVRQAIYVRETIREAGVQAFIAAPPVEGLEHGLKGVDDYIGAGGKIDQLHVLNKEAPLDQIAPWGLEQPWGDVATRLLTGLSLHADESGALYVPMGTLARIAGVRNKERLAYTLERYADDGAYTIEGSLETVVYEWPDKKRGGTVEVIDWKERPTIVVYPDFRAATSSSTIAEFSPR